MATTRQQKVYASLIGAIVFALLSSAFMYKLTARLSTKILPLSPSGPSTNSLILHAVVYFIAIYGIMVIQERK